MKYTKLNHVIFLVALVSTFAQDTECASSWKIDAEINQKVDLQCNQETTENEIEFIHFWILPNGDVLPPMSQDRSPHITLTINRLKIDRLVDTDIGLYFCVVHSKNNSTDVIKKGINIDVPHINTEWNDKIKYNAVIGGAVAVGTCILLITVWCLCICCSKVWSPRTDPEKPTTKVVPIDLNHQSNVSDSKNIKTVCDSIYHEADGTTVPNQFRDALIPATTQHETRIISYESGHYHSIGSLELDVIHHSSYGSTCTNLQLDEAKAKNEESNNFATGWIAEDSVFDEPNQSDEATHSTIGNNDHLEINARIRREMSAKRREDKELVHIINGEIVIESTGQTLAVPTTQPSSEFVLESIYSTADSASCFDAHSSNSSDVVRKILEWNVISNQRVTVTKQAVPTVVNSEKANIVCNSEHKNSTSTIKGSSMSSEFDADSVTKFNTTLSSVGEHASKSTDIKLIRQDANESRDMQSYAEDVNKIKHVVNKEDAMETIDMLL